MQSTSLLPRLAFLFGFSLSCAAAAYAAVPFATRTLVQKRTDFRLVTLQGQTAIDEASFRPIVQRLAEETAFAKVVVHMPNSQQKREVRYADLGVRVDVDETLSQLREAATRDAWFGRYLSKDAQRITDVSVRLYVDDASGFQALSPLKEEWDVPATSARLDLDNHTVVPEVKGTAVDLQGSLEVLRVAAIKHDHDVTLAFAQFSPKVSSEFVKGLDIGTVVAAYETNFSRAGEQVRRGSNIDVASSKLDGLVLSPGEVVSFNAVVGDRSEANGFKRSWEISKGEMVEGIGGGTCQVASTLHAASFFGGLDVVERLPHSRPSAYIPMGLDSTVVYPAVDLKLRNPHPFPVVVHAKTEGNKLKVEILGREKPVEVHFSRDVIGAIPFPRKLVEEGSLSGRKVIHKQHGIRGYRIRRVREMKYRDGTSKVETTTDYYPPTTDIYQVPVGFDESLLPVLPSADGAGEGAPNAKPVAPAQATVECTGADCPSAQLEIVEGKGAHAPTSFQSAPSARMRVEH
jgi:vancomycin resistance protein YoaR